MTPLIYVDGIDGSGKSMVCNYLQSKIDTQDTRIISFSEINYTLEQVFIKEFSVLDESLSNKFMYYTGNLNAMKLAYENIAAGNTVIMDRCVASFYAYQTHGNNDYITCELFDKLSEMARTPTIYVYCKVSHEISEKRVTERAEKRSIRDKRDFMSLDSRKKIIDGYDEFVTNIVTWDSEILDCNGTKKSVFSQLDDKVIPYINAFFKDFL